MRLTQNELDHCSTAIFFIKRVSELIIISNLHFQRIHYFALRNLPFRLESLTDAELGSRSHKIMHAGKTFSASFYNLTEI